MNRRRAFGALAGVLAAFMVAEAVLHATGVGASLPTKVALIDRAANTLGFHCYPTNAGDASSFEPLPQLDPARWLPIEVTEPPRRVGFDALVARPWCVPYRYGLPGLRGPAVPEMPLPGTLRIVGVGDSFAFGEGVRFDDTLFAQLGARLGPGVEVLNCAQSGADLSLDVETLEWAAGTFRAPRALLVLTLNDVSPPAAGGAGSVDFINVRSGDTPALVGWSRIGALLHSLVTGAGRTAATEEAYRRAHDPRVNAANLDRAEAELRRLGAASTGRTTAVVVYPLMYRLDAGYPFAEAHATLAGLAERAGLPVLDLLPAFAGEDASDLHVHAIDHHPNARAHGIAAAAIAAWLQDDVPGFLAR